MDLTGEGEWRDLTGDFDFCLLFLPGEAEDDLLCLTRDLALWTLPLLGDSGDEDAFFPRTGDFDF